MCLRSASPVVHGSRTLVDSGTIILGRSYSRNPSAEGCLRKIPPDLFKNPHNPKDVLDFSLPWSQKIFWRLALHG
jgi:hypothetical protein